MNKALLLIAAQMLRLAGNEFGHHVCNDLYLEPTLDSVDFVKEMIASSDDPKRVPHILPARTKSPFGGRDLSGMIFTDDVEVMFYCAKYLENFYVALGNAKKGNS